jgi:opacity protein-like surface antigen
MRRFALAVALALTLAAPASGADHLMTVNEVATSLSGSTANQYVELLDPFDEPFLAVGGYRLVSYDAAGVSMGDQPLAGGIGMIDGGTPMLIGKGSVGAAPDQALTVSLQTPNGQACFQRNDGSIINCMRWGSITNPVGLAATTGPSPGDGQSLQSCPSGAALGTATPKAANSCGGGGGGGGTTDTTKPKATLTTAPQKLGAVLTSGYKLKVRSNEKGKARAQLLRKGRVLRTLTKSVSAGVAKSFKLTIPRATKLALANARSATFTVKIRLTDAAGNVRNVTRTLILRR